jgi:hypothetical protein
MKPTTIEEIKNGMQFRFKVTGKIYTLSDIDLTRNTCTMKTPDGPKIINRVSLGFLLDDKWEYQEKPLDKAMSTIAASLNKQCTNHVWKIDYVSPFVPKTYYSCACGKKREEA